MSKENLEQTKAAVSISEMALMVGLSRQRFAQLRGTTFPEPDVDPTTGRPFYSEEKQKVCLEVRRRNCGTDGRPVLFYARRSNWSGETSRRNGQKVKAPIAKANDRHADLIDALKALGLVKVTTAQVEAVLAELYPSGAAGIADGEIIRAVFVRLHRQN